VIADHIRSCAFLIVDGVHPSNEGRGYVLRRIIRRAVRHGHQLGQTDAFFYQLVPALVAEMGSAYPELVELQDQVEKVLLAEEQQFEKTLEKGLAVLVKLYDTYGFPTDLTNDIARERNLEIDLEGYEKCMAEQRARARAAGNFSIDYSDTITLDGETEFLGYTTVADQGVKSSR